MGLNPHFMITSQTRNHQATETTMTISQSNSLLIRAKPRILQGIPFAIKIIMIGNPDWESRLF